MGVSHRLSLRFAEHEHLLVSSFEFLLSPGQPILPALQGGNGSLEALAVQRLIFESLRDGLVDDVQAVETIGDRFSGMRDVPREPLRPGDVLRAGDGSHLGAVERDRSATHQILFATEQHERGAGRDDRVGIVVSEGGNGPIIRLELAHQPHRFKVALAGALQMSR
jgi:hypothetical protein